MHYEKIVLKPLAVENFYPVYIDHTMWMHDFIIQSIYIDLSYSISCVCVENLEYEFMIMYSDKMLY